MLPFSTNIDVNIFSQTLSNKYLMNSYKLYWFAGILEEIKSGNNNISFRNIVYRMITRSWYSLLKFKLHFGYQDRLYVLVQYVQKISSLNEKASESEIIDFLKNSNDINLNKLIKKFYTFVPYRFLSPFYYNELKGVPESSKNSTLKNLSVQNPIFYSIQNESITLLHQWFNYIFENQIIIEGWLNLQLVTFLQKRNPNVPSISEKLSAPKLRNLSVAKKFWSIINDNSQIKNIYSGTSVPKNSFSIDHFIPWSFVLHDKLWNLVPISRSMNSIKSDRIPNLNLYLKNFCDQQFSAFNSALTIGLSPKLLEDYVFLNNIELKKGFPKDIFVKSLKEVIKPLHQLAMNQGFQVWEI